MGYNGKKASCEAVDESKSGFDGRLANSIVNCLEVEHQRFGEPLMRLAAAAAGLVQEPSNAELRAAAMEAWGRLKTDLWSHIERENGLIFLWAVPRLEMPAGFVETLTREQDEIRELVKRIEGDGAASDELAQARALAAIAELLDEHIERHETVSFHAIRQATARRSSAPLRPAPMRGVARTSSLALVV